MTVEKSFVLKNFNALLNSIVAKQPKEHKANIQGSGY